MDISQSPPPPLPSSPNIPSFQPGKRGGVFFRIILGVVALAGIFMAYTIFSDSINPNALKGNIVNMVYIPKGESGLLWLLTDDSFYYTAQIQTPGSFSISTESLLNKTYSYLYDPVAKTVIQKVKTDYPKTPPHPKMFYDSKKNGVWMITESSSRQEADVRMLAAGDVTKELMSTRDFINKFPQLSSGLGDLAMSSFAKGFNLTTKDGQKYFYSLDDNKLFTTDTEYKQKDANREPKTIAKFALSGSDPRKSLYKLVGPRTKLDNDFSDGFINDPSTIKFFYDAVATPLMPDKGFIEGYIVYQDPELAVVAHQDQVAKDAARMLTCVDKDGKILWTIGQDKLFSEMKLSDDDAFSSMFFLKEKMQGLREGNLFLFKFEETGIMGIDLTTGEVKWELKM